MTRFVFTLIILLVFGLYTQAQVGYAGRIETGYQYYLFRAITYEAGPDWQGYYLSQNQSGFSIATSHGLCFANQKLYTGIGLGYLNFQGTDGASVFGDLEYLPFKTKVTPLVFLRLGYSHLWNQYEGGTGSTHAEFGLGVNYRIKEHFGLYIKSGFTITQQAFLVPVALGFRF